MTRKTPFLLCIIIGVLLCAFTTTAAPQFTEQQYQSLFARFADRYKKAYEASEFFKRFELFKENLNFIMNFNDDKKNTHTLAMNQFGDMTEKEWEQYKGLRVPTKLGSVAEEHNPEPALANVKEQDSLDWRDKGVVNPVYNQGSCGSCWAWATTAALESAWAIATKQLLPLSVQQLVDCDRTSQGCGGGWMTNAMDYLIKNGGSCAATEYPYQGRQGRCRDCTKIAKIKGYYDFRGKPEAMIVKGINLAPVAVAVQSNSRGFMFYKSGIISSQCGRNLDHAITAVGYGTDPATGMDYYIVRNSWGKGWGENGYVRIQRGKNMCGIASNASSPIVAA